MKLLFRNLARTTTEDELRTLFGAHGTIEYLTLVLDAETGKSKGFGFVEMPHEEHAQAAIAGLNGKTIANHRIRVKPAE